MTKPLVSVVMPVYNCAAYIREAVESVLMQEYHPMELLVVDDGSEDNTLSVLATFGDRIRLLNQANAGPAAARNRAVHEARGEWLAFLDGDDLWLPGQPALAMSYVERRPETKVIFADWLVWHAQADGSYAPLPTPAPIVSPEVDPEGTGWLYAKLLLDSLIPMISALTHRSVYDAVGGFDEGLRTGSDYDFWIKVSRRFPVVKLRAPVAVYRQNSTSVTNTMGVVNNPYRVLKRAIDTYGLTDDVGNSVTSSAAAHRLADLAFTHGWRHYWRGDAKVALQAFVRALGHRPLHAKAAAYVIASVARYLGVYRPTRTRDR